MSLRDAIIAAKLKKASSSAAASAQGLPPPSVVVVDDTKTIAHVDAFVGAEVATPMSQVMPPGTQQVIAAGTEILEDVRGEAKGDGATTTTTTTPLHLVVTEAAVAAATQTHHHHHHHNNKDIREGATEKPPQEVNHAQSSSSSMEPLTPNTNEHPVRSVDRVFDKRLRGTDTPAVVDPNYDAPAEPKKRRISEFVANLKSGKTSFL
jgi:hypothetical protein